jgi:hypothetical protein
VALANGAAMARAKYINAPAVNVYMGINNAAHPWRG